MPCISCGGFVSLFLSPKRMWNWFAAAVSARCPLGELAGFGAQRGSRSRALLTDTALRNGGCVCVSALQELYGLYLMLF